MRKLSGISIAPLFLLLFLLLFPASALAGSDGHDAHPAGLSSLLWPALNFFLYACLLLFVYRKYGRDLLKKYSANFEALLNQAQKTVADAELEFDGLRQRLEFIDTEKRDIFERFDREAEQLSRLIAENGEKTAGEMQGDNERRIASELKRAKAAIRGEVVLKATEIARKKLVGELSEDEDHRLREEALNTFIS